MLLTSIVISVIAILLSLWMGRRNPVRSSGITSGMLVLLMFTPLLFILPKIEVNWLKSDLLRNAVLSEKVAAESSNVISPLFSSVWLWSLSGIWAVGSIILLTRLLSQCYTIKKWCREAEVTPSARDLKLIEECAEQLQLQVLPEIRYTSKLNSPVITGLLKPVLLLPRTSTEWSRETLRMVIIHELGHLQRRDLWTNMAAHIACALHWFNPLVWMLRKRLLNECEYACDAHVISHGTNAKTYINALCDVAESCQQIISNKNKAPVAVLAMANKASLKSRVRNVLDGQNNSNPWLVIAILGLSASVTIGYTLVRPQQERAIDVLKPQATEAPADYTDKEINLRLNANPFPAE